MEDVALMFTRELKQAGHSKRFTIHAVPGQGWEVREESDTEVVRLVRYRDWHRVERALDGFKHEILDLRERGWQVGEMTGWPA